MREATHATTDGPGILPTRESTYGTSIDDPAGSLVGLPVGTIDGVEVSPGLPADYWSQLLSNFVDGHNPSNIVQFVFVKYFEKDQPRKVTIHLHDPRPLWQRIFVRVFPRACVHAFDLPRVYKGSVNDGMPLIVDSGSSVCITPNHDDFTVYRASQVKIKDLSKSNTVAGEGFV